MLAARYRVAVLSYSSVTQQMPVFGQRKKLEFLLEPLHFSVQGFSGFHPSKGDLIINEPFIRTLFHFFESFSLLYMLHYFHYCDIYFSTNLNILFLILLLIFNFKLWIICFYIYVSLTNCCEEKFQRTSKVYCTKIKRCYFFQIDGALESFLVQNFSCCQPTKTTLI